MLMQICVRHSLFFGMQEKEGRMAHRGLERRMLIAFLTQRDPAHLPPPFVISEHPTCSIAILLFFMLYFCECPPSLLSSQSEKI